MARRQVEADELAAKCGELRLAGLSYRDVAKGIGCSLGAAYAGFKRFRKSLIRGDVASEREILLARCEKQYRQLATKLQAGDTKAHAVGVQIIELMSVIGGYQAPVQVAVDVNGRAPFTKFEYVVEPLPDEPSIPLQEGQRRLLEPAEEAQALEVAG